MNRGLPLGMTLLLLGLIALPLAQRTTAQTGTGWVTLLDGKNLDSWDQIGTADWRLEDGAAVADKGNGFLVSKKSYADFQLRAEFWIDDDANSGIFIRCTDPANVGGKTAYEGQHLGQAARSDLRHRGDCRRRQGRSNAESGGQMERL